jgi:hypothetical protein
MGPILPEERPSTGSTRVYDTVVVLGPFAVATFLGWLAGYRIVRGRWIGAIAVGVVAASLGLAAVGDDGGPREPGEQTGMAVWAGLVWSALVTAFVVPMVATWIWRNYERELNESDDAAPSTPSS